LTAQAVAGRTVFETSGCGSCHSGVNFTSSASATLMNVGTIKPSSGTRLNATLTGIDPPTLRDVWASAPYLHDGSAATLPDAIRAHTSVSLADSAMASLTAYLLQIGDQETTAPVPVGAGLVGRYFANTTLSGTAVLTRTEAINFDWANSAPGPGVAADNFSVRWTGEVQAPRAGTFRFRTVSDDGVRLWVNGVLVINNWSQHAATTNTSGSITLAANQKYTIKMEYFEAKGKVVLAVVLAGHVPALADAGPPARTLMATPPRTLSDFVLTDQAGKPTRLAQLRGAPALVLFGFTHCPTVCPTELARLRELERRHAADLGRTRIVIVSVDGERDSPEAMSDWLSTFSTQFIGLTGTPRQVRDVASQFSAAFYKTPGKVPAEYLMEHNSQIFLLDAEGRLRATFFNADLATMAAVTKSVAAEHRR
jgi:cytochrome oxidase Cu insertion factor (SCO1/SenC/PrrC family)